MLAKALETERIAHFIVFHSPVTQQLIDFLNSPFGGNLLYSTKCLETMAFSESDGMKTFPTLIDATIQCLYSTQIAQLNSRWELKMNCLLILWHLSFQSPFIGKTIAQGEGLKRIIVYIVQSLFTEFELDNALLLGHAACGMLMNVTDSQPENKHTFVTVGGIQAIEAIISRIDVDELINSTFIEAEKTNANLSALVTASGVMMNLAFDWGSGLVLAKSEALQNIITISTALLNQCMLLSSMVAVSSKNEVGNVHDFGKVSADIQIGLEQNPQSAKTMRIEDALFNCCSTFAGLLKYAQEEFEHSHHQKVKTIRALNFFC